jgi:zinc protease
MSRPLYATAVRERRMVPSRIPRPATRSFRLANGLTVVLAPDPRSPTASVWVWYRVGSVNERPGITGASHWVEHMLFEGSPRYGKGEIDRAVVSVGGELNAFTDSDFTAYFTTVPKEHLAIPLDIESDRMTRALITDREVARERTVIFSEREGNENWPEFRVEEELYQLAFREHPYRWDALGRRDDIERMSAAELREYYRRFYGTRNAILVIAGGFEPGRVAREVRMRFGRLRGGGEDVTVAAVEPAPRGERRAELSGPGTTPYVQVGFRAPALDSPATPATIVLDAIVGGETRLFSSGSGWGRSSEHPSSRLYRALVDPGLAVRATSEWRPRRYPGLFTVQAQAARGVGADRLERAILRVLDRLAADGPTAREVAEFRAKLRRSTVLAYEGASRIGFRLGYFSVLGSPEVEDEIFRDLLRVRPTDVRSRARELFRSEARVVVRYLPRGGPAPG